MPEKGPHHVRLRRRGLTSLPLNSQAAPSTRDDWRSTPCRRRPSNSIRSCCCAGEKWKKLSDPYKKRKRKKRPGRKILDWYGDLRKSLTQRDGDRIARTSGDVIEVGSKHKLAEIHQKGFRGVVTRTTKRKARKSMQSVVPGLARVLGLHHVVAPVVCSHAELLEERCVLVDQQQPDRAIQALRRTLPRRGSLALEQGRDAIQDLRNPPRLGGIRVRSIASTRSMRQG